MATPASSDQDLQSLFAYGQRLVAEELNAVQAELDLLRTQQELSALAAEQQQLDQAVAQCCEQVLEQSVIDVICAATDEEEDDNEDYCKAKQTSDKGEKQNE